MCDLPQTEYLSINKNRVGDRIEKLGTDLNSRTA